MGEAAEGEDGASGAVGLRFAGGGFGGSPAGELAADFVGEFVEARGGFAAEEETFGEEAVKRGVRKGAAFVLPTGRGCLEIRQSPLTSRNTVSRSLGGSGWGSPGWFSCLPCVFS
jgi:hypothetical protein